jgi:hypothetical protein
MAPQHLYDEVVGQVTSCSAYSINQAPGFNGWASKAFLLEQAQSQFVPTPAARTDSLRGFALAWSRVERHIQRQSLLAGCSFGPLELAGDLDGGCLLPRERLEFANVLRAPRSPSRLFDHLALPEFSPPYPLPLAGKG